MRRFACSCATFRFPQFGKEINISFSGNTVGGQYVVYK